MVAPLVLVALLVGAGIGWALLRGGGEGTEPAATGGLTPGQEPGGEGTRPPGATDGALDFVGTTAEVFQDRQGFKFEVRMGMVGRTTTDFTGAAARPGTQWVVLPVTISNLQADRPYTLDLLGLRVRQPQDAEREATCRSTGGTVCDSIDHDARVLDGSELPVDVIDLAPGESREVVIFGKELTDELFGPRVGLLLWDKFLPAGDAA